MSRTFTNLKNDIIDGLYNQYKLKKLPRQLHFLAAINRADNLYRSGSKCNINSDYNIAYIAILDITTFRLDLRYIRLSDLKSMMGSGTLDIENIVYNPSTNIIRGKYCSLSNFSVDNTNAKAVALLKTDTDSEILVLSLDTFRIQVISNANPEVNSRFIINMDKNNIMCKSIEVPKAKAKNILSTGNTGSTNGINEIIQHVKDKDYALSYDEFKQYMQYNGWNYTITKDSAGLDISYVDSKCTLLHLPVGTVQSSYLFRDNIEPETEIIINGDFLKLENLLFANKKEKVKLKSIHIQKNRYNAERILDLCGLQNIYVTDCISLSCNAGLNNAFCNSYIKNIKCTDKCILEYCSGSFNNSCIHSGILQVSKVMRDSFNGAYKSHIEFTRTCAEVRQSFNGCDRCYINIVNRKNSNIQQFMFQSFTGMSECVIKLDKCANLYSMSECFDESNILDTSNSDSADNTLDLSRTKLKTISECFYNSNITRIRLPETIQRIKNKNSKITFVLTGNIKEIKQELFSVDYYNVNVDYETQSIESMDSLPFRLSKLPPTLTTIKGLAAQLSDEDLVFDTRSFTKLNKLSNNEFLGCGGLRTLIIPNIQRIECEKLFCYCDDLSDIVFGEDLEYINTSVFNTMDSKYDVMRVYIVKNSLTDLTLKRCMNGCNVMLDIVYVDSIDEAVHRATSIGVPQSVINRSRMLINQNDNFGKLFSELEAQGDEGVAAFPFLYKAYNIISKRKNLTGAEAEAEKAKQFTIDVSTEESRETLPISDDLSCSAWQVIGKYRKSHYGDELDKLLYLSLRKMLLDISSQWDGSVVPMKYNDSMINHIIDGNFTGACKWYNDGEIIAGYKDNLLIHLGISNNLLILIHNSKIEGIFRAYLKGALYVNNSTFSLRQVLKSTINVYDLLNEHDIIKVHLVSSSELIANISNCRLNSCNLSRIGINKEFLLMKKQFISIYQVPLMGCVLYNVFSGKYCIGNISNEQFNISKKFNSFRDAMHYITDFAGSCTRITKQFGAFKKQET